MVELLGGSDDVTVCAGEVATSDWVHNVKTQGRDVHLTHEPAEGNMHIEYHSDGTIHYLQWKLESDQDVWTFEGSQDHGDFTTSWQWNGVPMSHTASLGWTLNGFDTGDCDVVTVTGNLDGEPLFTTGVASVVAKGTLCNPEYHPEKCTI